MKRTRQPKTVKDPEAHYNNVSKLFDLIALKYEKTRGDIVIAYHQDISVYNTRMWLIRPIPKKHWRVLCQLSGLPLEEIEHIAS
jgi:hypothetical protein